ncbi:MAG: TolC family protein [Gemmatimonadota bacterium]
MNRPLVRLLAAALPAAVISGLGGPVRAEEVPLSLDAAVRSAVEKNLTLRAETYNPAIADTDIRKAGAIYNPRLGALVDHHGEDAPLDTAGDLVRRSRFFDANLSADFLLATGATASAAFSNLWTRSTESAGAGTGAASTTTRFVEPRLSLSLTQPLLQGFGKDVTEQGITVAKFGKESSLLQWRNTALAVVSTVRDQYFALIKAMENLETQKAALAVLQEVDAGNQARVRAGVLASVELLDSAFGVAEAEVTVLAARKSVRDASDALRTTIQFPPGVDLAPTETFPDRPLDHSEQAAVEAALRDRPDLRIARVNLKTEEFNARIARNATLPSLGLTGSAGLEALGSGYSDALSDVSSAKYPFWSVGLSFAYPLGNDAAEAGLAASRLRARQTEVQIRNLEESILLDVRTAIRALETNWSAVEAAHKGVRFGEARLESFVKRQKLGLAVTKDVLQAQSDLTSARQTLTNARADYQGAVTQYWKSTGELLDRQGIRIDDGTIENQAWKDLR